MEGNGIMRPNRSDVHVSKEEEAKIEEATREYFDGIAPRRHTKPQRSDYSSSYTDDIPSHDAAAIPELVQFQRLENDPNEKLVYNGSSQVTEEFVETEYYKDLNGIDKQHHTTGTGFIKVENAKGDTFNIRADSATDSCHAYKGNPATNDWIPAAVDSVRCQIEFATLFRSEDDFSCHGEPAFIPDGHQFIVYYFSCILLPPGGIYLLLYS